MADFIYQVDPLTKKPFQINPMSFVSIGIKERDDLEEWVIANPELLGERLLIITFEFDRFDKSNRRLDVLALDQSSVLVVIELKLDIERSLADLQAIRYAAFCSTMNMDDILALMADYQGTSKEEAAEKVCDFLEVEELPN